MRLRTAFHCGVNGAMQSRMTALAGLIAVTTLMFFAAPPGNTQGQSTELKLLLGDVSLNKLPFVLAYEEGIFKKNGLDVKPMFTPGSVAIIRRSGVDVPDEFILKGDTQTPIKIGGACPTIVGLTTRAGRWDPMILGSTHLTSRWRIVSRSDITSAEQLKGKRIGYSGYGAVTHFVAYSFAEAMGWDPNYDWSMIANGLGVEALQLGHVDAFIAPSFTRPWRSMQASRCSSTCRNTNCLLQVLRFWSIVTGSRTTGMQLADL